MVVCKICCIKYHIHRYVLCLRFLLFYFSWLLRYNLNGDTRNTFKSVQNSRIVLKIYYV